MGYVEIQRAALREVIRIKTGGKKLKKKKLSASTRLPEEILGLQATHKDNAPTEQSETAVAIELLLPGSRSGHRNAPRQLSKQKWREMEREEGESNEKRKRFTFKTKTNEFKHNKEEKP